MHCRSCAAPHIRSLAAALLFLGATTVTFAADTFSGGVLTLPSLAIGNATYANVVISPISLADVLAYTRGGAAGAGGDSYDPAASQLTIATIVVGTATYNNVIVSVPGSSSVSIGGISGADTYQGGNLSIPRVQLNGTVYTNVVASVATIVSAGGGLPAAAWDTYNPSSGQLTIAAIDYNSRIYTNAVVTVGRIISGGTAGFSGFAYAASSTGGLVAQYAVGLNGQLTALSPAAIHLQNGTPQDITAEATRRFVYVTDSEGGAIYQYRVGASGLLAPLIPAFVTPGFTPGLLVANPQGPYLYAAAGAAGIYQYNIGAEGALTPMTHPFATGDSVESSLSTDPRGAYLLVSSSEFDVPAVSVHSIGADGSAMSPTLFPSVSPGVAILMDATATNLYQVTDSGINHFSGDGLGNFTPAENTPTPGNSAIVSATLDPTGKFVYVLGKVVSQFTIGSQGVLQALSPATVKAGTGPASIAFDPTGRFAYVANLDGTVSQYSIGLGGALNPLNPASVTSPAAAQALVVVPLQSN